MEQGWENILVPNSSIERSRSNHLSTVALHSCTAYHREIFIEAKEKKFIRIIAHLLILYSSFFYILPGVKFAHAISVFFFWYLIRFLFQHGVKNLFLLLY